MNISDKVNFKRKITQVISSSPFVKLEDGSYMLTAKIKNSQGFNNLEMYILSNGKRNKAVISEENKEWKTIEIKNFMIKKGNVEVGFLVDGKASSFCLIDDVSLVKSKK